MSQKRRGHLDLYAVNLQKVRFRIVIAWFQCSLDFGVKCGLLLVLRSQFFEYLRETGYKHALEHLEAARSQKKMGGKNAFLRRKRLRVTIIDLFEGLWLVGTHFRR